MGWQPIETAPKDGLEVDLYVAEAGRIPDCQWRGAEWATRGDAGWERLPAEHFRPTHWMPLPKAPDA